MRNGYMVRIAILSDIHFGKFSRTSELAVPGEKIQDDNQGAISLTDGLIRILKEFKVEYIFIAGDLTSVASPQEFYFCEKKMLEIAREIGIESEKIICCLGNHDIDRNITRISDQVLQDTNNDEVKSIIRKKYNLIAASCANSNLETISLNKENVGPAPYSGLYEDKNFIVFVLNSGWQCTHDQEHAHGKLTKIQLSWLDEMARKFKEDSRIKIVLVHHHPVKYSYPLPALDISEIEEGSEFMEVINRNGINIVIHGHRHHPIAKTIQIGTGSKPITLICAGSLSVNSLHRNNGEIPNTMHILELNAEDQSSILYNYKYTASEGWKELEFCKNTPLDYKMKLGKLFTGEEIKEEVRKLPAISNSISWDKLNEKLQYITYSELNDIVKEELKDKYRIIGKFPDEICFLPR